MDTLALLCNLHAEGPATLQRLRRSGCESLAGLLPLSATDLAGLLDWPTQRAERFLREAALLFERLDDAPRSRPELEEDEPDANAELDEVEEEDESEDEDEDEQEEELDAEEELLEEAAEDAAGFAPPSERVAAVLGAWRELDRVAPPSEPTDYVVPRPPPLPDRRLAESALELEPALVARLASHGVLTLRQLVSAEDASLARALGLGFTRLKHLQFLAGRELVQVERTPVAPPPEHALGIQAFAPPPSEPFETAGPFA
jgi:hypothetical protein